jgi:hypothetical protein
MPCVVDAIDRPAAVVSFQFPESFQIRPPPAAESDENTGGAATRGQERRGGPPFFASVETGPGL